MQLLALIIVISGCMIITRSSYLDTPSIQWTHDAMSVFADDVGIDHGRSQIGVA